MLPAMNSILHSISSDSVQLIHSKLSICGFSAVLLSLSHSLSTILIFRVLTPVTSPTHISSIVKLSVCNFLNKKHYIKLIILAELIDLISRLRSMLMEIRNFNLYSIFATAVKFELRPKMESGSGSYVIISDN